MYNLNNIDLNTAKLYFDQRFYVLIVNSINDSTKCNLLIFKKAFDNLNYLANFNINLIETITKKHKFFFINETIKTIKIDFNGYQGDGVIDDDNIMFNLKLNNSNLEFKGNKIDLNEKFLKANYYFLPKENNYFESKDFRYQINLNQNEIYSLSASNSEVQKFIITDIIKDDLKITLKSLNENKPSFLDISFDLQYKNNDFESYISAVYTKLPYFNFKQYQLETTKSKFIEQKILPLNKNLFLNHLYNPYKQQSITILHGRDGKDGKDGKQGEPGKDGRDGIQGNPGINGNHGMHGLPCKDGDDMNIDDLINKQQRLDKDFILIKKDIEMLKGYNSKDSISQILTDIDKLNLLMDNILDKEISKEELKEFKNYNNYDGILLQKQFKQDDIGYNSSNPGFQVINYNCKK